MNGPTSVPERWPTGRWKRLGIALLYALLGAAAVYVLVRNLDHPNDLSNFLRFGTATLAGLNPYDPAVADAYSSGHLWSTWPPSFAPIAALLARLQGWVGTAATVFLWHGANLLALALMMGFCVRWLYGRRLSLKPGSGRMPLYLLPALVGLLVPSRLVLSNFEHSQSNLLFLGLAVAAFWLFRRGRRWGGGLAMGLATAFKAIPLALLPYLAWRGRWRDLGASLAGVAFAWGVLPALLAGPAGAVEWYASWAGFAGGIDLPLAIENQSLQGTLSRWMAGPGDPTVGDHPHAPAAGPLGAYGAEWIVAGLMILLGGASARAFGRPGRGVGPRREALEVGVALAALGLFSPIAWKFHFVGLVVLAAALYARTRPGLAPGSSGPAIGLSGRRTIRGLLLLAFLAVTGSATGLVGGGISDRFEHYGVVTWTTLALILAGLGVLWRQGRPAGPLQPPDPSRAPSSAAASRASS